MANRAAAPGPLGEVPQVGLEVVVGILNVPEGGEPAAVVAERVSLPRRNRDRFARPDGPPLRAEDEFDLALEDLEHLEVVRMDVWQRYGAAVGEPELHDDRVAGPARGAPAPGTRTHRRA
jgi:hypothetical protein